jgi:aspartyl/asparaginyl beta-hydroxylase (cupin superfamily)
MAKLTKKQMNTFVDYAYQQHMAESFDKSASCVLRDKDDLDQYCKYLEMRNECAAEAVLIARHDIGMTDDQIKKCSMFLIEWANAASEKAAA